MFLGSSRSITQTEMKKAFGAGYFLVLFGLTFAALSSDVRNSRSSSSGIWRPSNGDELKPRELSPDDPYHALLPKGSGKYPLRHQSSHSPFLSNSHSSPSGFRPPLGSQSPFPISQRPQSDALRYLPSRSPEPPGLEQNYLNALGSGRPTCARKRDYCLYNHDYPMDMMNSLIQRHRSDVYSMYSQMHGQLPPDGATLSNRTYRYNFPSESGAWICETDVYLMRIGWARNWAGQWKVVLNTDQFPQTVRVEHCKHENRSCQFMPPCVQSTCLQRYTAVQLLSADPQSPNLTPIVDTFLLPGGCSCFVEEFKFA